MNFNDIQTNTDTYGIRIYVASSIQDFLTRQSIIMVHVYLFVHDIPKRYMIAFFMICSWLRIVSLYSHSILNVVLDCIIPKRRSLMMAFMIFRCVNLLWKFSIIFRRVIASVMVVVIVSRVNYGINLRWYYFMIFQSVSVHVCWRISWS